MNGWDVYFEARLAFVDRPDVRLRTYDDRARAGIVVEARSNLVHASFGLDDHFMATAPMWALRDAMDDFRRGYARHERNSVNRLAGAPIVG